MIPALTAASVAGEVDSLRLSIEDLRLTFGPRYAKGDAFLGTLKALELGLASPATNESFSASAELARLKRDALTANPLVSDQPLLFVVREQYRPDHHNTATFFPNALHEFNDGRFSPGGALKRIDFGKGGECRTLFETAQGVIRDPEVFFDGSRIVFSMRRDVEDSYHIYEVNADGSGLRQLTFARDVDDLDPLYLPDGSIGFSSTREPKYCMCNRHIMANLFRMEADGANIRQIGKSTLWEGHGSLMPDGRILYDRWEYVDRNFGDAQALWTVNPDGTCHAVYWGNNTASPGAVIDARIIPGTERAICVFGSCHDRPWGALAIIDRARGLDGKAPVIRTWPAEATNMVQQSGWQIFDTFASIKLKYQSPFPLNDKYFLCSRMIGKGEQMGIYLLDVFGNEVLLHTEAPGCFDPMPLGARVRPPVIPARRDYAHGTGTFYVQDVYLGTHMNGIERGSVKWLRVVEAPEKRFWTKPPWEGQGQEAPAMNWHDFNNKRILGTVPVKSDGSAYFEVPSDRFVYFQLLDAKGMMVQSMRSGVMVQSGERAGCTGCHEDRRQAPPVQSGGLQALGGAPHPLEGWRGGAREFNYLAEVQPVFNRRCVGCHDYGKNAGKTLNLAADHDLVFNTSYNELWRKKYIQTVGAGPSDTQPAFAWGSHASKLVQTILGNPRCGGSLTPEDFDRIVTWIDLNGPYYPSYASAHPENLAGRCPLDDLQLAKLEKLTGIELRRQAGFSSNPGPQISFERPELSPCLGKFADESDPRRSEAIEIIRAGQILLAQQPEADMPRFQPCELDQWRDAKYQARLQVEEANRAAIRSERKRFDGGTE